MYLSDNLYYWRKKNNLTYMELESLSGIPHNNLHRIESGKTENPGIISIMKLAKVMNITIDTLLYENIAPVLEK